jgi:ribosomal protein L11 methyltransferase
MKVWRKLASAKWEDAWEERLASFAPGRALIARHPARPFLRIEVWDVGAREAERLVREFGGRVVDVDSRRAIARGLERPRPIRVRGKLLVVSSPEDLPAPSVAARVVPSLLIPAGLAFGTGSHPTTATCLRFLCDAAGSLPRGGWTMADVGTGTGILAMAARLLGARSATAFDNDPAAVRAAKESIRANGLDRIAVKRADLESWEPEAASGLVAANLFRDLLVAHAAKLCRAVAPGGYLLVSGFLRDQETDVFAAMAAAGMVPLRIGRSGKWVAALLARGEADLLQSPDPGAGGVSRSRPARSLSRHASGERPAARLK